MLKNMIGRVYFIHPSNQELYSLRQILMRKAGATSFADLRTHNNWQYSTFTEAAIAMGLLDSDDEWEQTLTEAFSFMTSGNEMRKLFVVILSQCRPSNPGKLWQKYKDDLSRDILHQYKIKNNLPDYTYSEIIYQKTLELIDGILNDFGQKISDFYGIPQLNKEIADDYGATRLISQETNYNAHELKKELKDQVSKFNVDQKYAFDRITGASDNSSKKCS